MIKKSVFKPENGFTLMEMIVVLAIIGLLIAGGISYYNGYIENSKVIKAKSQITIMQGAMDSWYAEHGAYPTNTEDQRLAGIDTEAKDPWGKNYLIDVKPEGIFNTYVISTGCAQVHQNKVVAGRGEDGRSEEPTLMAPAS